MIFLTLLSQAKFTDVESDTVVDVVVVICAILGAVFLVVSLVEKFRVKKAGGMVISPDPLQVQEVERLATKAELQEMSSRLRGDIDGLRRSIDDEKRTNYTENSKLHHRVDELVESLSETKGLLIGVKENTDRLLERSMR